uniref:Centrosomal protein 43 n=1 Tax=Leptobrachium leishanense TaxID=445787 RepID=A0A8C5M603_9ANUR
MSATEEDTELRDLLIQTLENNGVLNKIKAELRASVFLALEEQEKVENKTPLINESLKRFLSSRDGRLVANIFAEFLQFFNLDFTLAVFQPEACLGKIEDRSQLAKDLGIIESEGPKTGPLILELIKKCHQKDKIISSGEGDKLLSLPKELSPKQIAEAQKKFDLYKDRNSEISKDELRSLFLDLFPHFHRNMLERYVNDEFKAADKDFNNGIDFHEFIGMYKRLFIHCRSVVAHDVSDIIHSPRRALDGKTSAQGIQNKTESSGEKSSSSYKELKKPDIQMQNDGRPDCKLSSNLSSEPIKSHNLELEEDSIEGDSFFDDPIPKPEKTYGWKNEERKFYNQSASPSLNTTIGSHLIAPIAKEADGGIHLTSLKDLKTVSSKMASLELGGGNEDDYVDDFNSTSQRSDKSDVSIGEEIEEDDLSVDDLLGSDKIEDLTSDCTISQISNVGDYLEEIS